MGCCAILENGMGSVRGCGSGAKSMDASRESYMSCVIDFHSTSLAFIARLCCEKSRPNVHGL